MASNVGSKQQEGKKSKNKHSKHGSGGGKEKNFLNLSIPGMGFLRKFQQYRRLPQETPANQRLEEELDRLTNKIDNLLNRMDGQELEMAQSQEEECLVCGSNKATMQTLPCAHKVVCRQCFVRTIQMAVAQKRLPLRCILCRAKVLRLHQEGADKEAANLAAAAANMLPKSVSGYNIQSNNISSSGSNYSFVSGISQVSSESAGSRKGSITRDFSFSSLSNFQNVNLLNKSQIPRSKSGSFSSRRSRRSRSPSPGGLPNNRSRSMEVTRSRSMEPVPPPRIRVDRTPSDENISVSPVSPCSPGLLPTRFSNFGGGGPRSPRSPTSPTSPCSPSDGSERLFSGSSRGSSRLSTPLSPIKESRKEMMGSLQELSCSPVHEPVLNLQPPPLAPSLLQAPQNEAPKPSSRIRCAEKIVKQLESTAGSKQTAPNMNVQIERLQNDIMAEYNCGEGVLINLSDDNDVNSNSIPAHPVTNSNQIPTHPATGRRPSLQQNHNNNNNNYHRVKQSKSVSFKDC